MVYLLTFSESELAGISARLAVERRLTKAMPKEMARPSDIVRSRTTLVLARSDNGMRELSWLGVAAHVGSIGAREDSVTIDPLAALPFGIPVDGPDGLLARLPEQARNDFGKASAEGTPAICSQSVWDAIDQDLRSRYPDLAVLLNWLKSLASPAEFNDRDAADRSWQEQKDCVDCLVRIFGLPLLALASWRRPDSREATYLSGVVPQPNEQSMIDQDTTAIFRSYPLVFDGWQEGANRNIHVLRDAHGRQLEFVNVNDSTVESRTGTDMIYYYMPTRSFVLVQYKRINSRNDELPVDDRLRRQLDRLEQVSNASLPAAAPSDWRLGHDPCFLKVAYWPESAHEALVPGVTPGMYLPLSYVRLLLADDATLGPRQGRLLSYKRVERHLIGSQFIDLVVHGLVGTTAVTREQLLSIVATRVNEGNSVTVAVEQSGESPNDRANRARSRGGNQKRSYQHDVIL